jgi:hypothetical protein
MPLGVATELSRSSQFIKRLIGAHPEKNPPRSQSSQGGEGLGHVDGVVPMRGAGHPGTEDRSPDALADQPQNQPGKRRVTLMGAEELQATGSANPAAAPPRASVPNAANFRRDRPCAGSSTPSY